jgi:hypothetical protein
MLARLATRLGKRLLRLRAATVELMLGSLITCYGLRQISKKGQVGDAKVMYLAAMAYNLKKYLRAAAPSNPLAWPSPCPYPVPLFGA